jgi:hypothetical protein
MIFWALFLDVHSRRGTIWNVLLKKKVTPVYSVLKKRPMMTDFTVVLVGENLGY